MTARRNPAETQDALDARFSRFGLHPLTEGDVWALSMAAMVMPDGNPGAEAYLTQVSGIDAFVGRLTVWGRVIALGVAGGQYKARNGARRRTYVEGYSESWGRYAVADGLTLALYGTAADALGMSASNCQGYIRVRDFVGGALLDAIAEYHIALEWATGSRRDRVLTGRWEGITGLNYRESRERGKMDYPSAYPMFAPGCGRTVPLKDMAEAYEDQPETLYRSLRPTDWWDDTYARDMRRAPVTTYTLCPPIPLASCDTTFARHGPIRTPTDG